MAEQNARSGRVVIFQRDYGIDRELMDEWDRTEEEELDQHLQRALENDLLQQETPLPRFVDRMSVMQFFTAVAVCDRIANDSTAEIRAVLDYDEYTAEIELIGTFLDVGMEDYLPHFGLILIQADQIRIETMSESPFTVRIRMPYFKDPYLCP